jgi:hypothetical protein
VKNKTKENSSKVYVKIKQKKTVPKFTWKENSSKVYVKNKTKESSSKVYVQIKQKKTSKVYVKRKQKKTVPKFTWKENSSKVYVKIKQFQSLRENKTVPKFTWKWNKRKQFQSLRENETVPKFTWKENTSKVNVKLMIIFKIHKIQISMSRHFKITWRFVPQMATVNRNLQTRSGKPHAEATLRNVAWSNLTVRTAAPRHS